MTHSSAVVIGAAGGSGSGKTSVVRAIIDRFGEDRIGLIEHDSYYLNLEDMTPETGTAVNFDHPDSLETSLLVEHIQTLRAGHPVDVPIYDYGTHSRTDRTRRVEPTPVLIVEGILVLAHPMLRRLMDIRVYVDTDADLRILRRLMRDMKERDRSFDSVVEQYLKTVRPMHIEFVEPSRRHAHIIVPEGAQNLVALDQWTRVSRPWGPQPTCTRPLVQMRSNNVSGHSLRPCGKG